MLCLFPDYNSDHNPLPFIKSEASTTKEAKNRKEATNKNGKAKKQKATKNLSSKTYLYMYVSSSIIFDVIKKNVELDTTKLELARCIFDRVCHLKSVNLIYTTRIEKMICSYAMVAERYSRLSQRTSNYIKQQLQNYMKENPVWGFRVYASEFANQKQFQRASVENAKPPAAYGKMRNTQMRMERERKTKVMVDEAAKARTRAEAKARAEAEAKAADDAVKLLYDMENDDYDGDLPTMVPLHVSTAYQGNNYVAKVRVRTETKAAAKAQATAADDAVKLLYEMMMMVMMMMTTTTTSTAYQGNNCVYLLTFIHAEFIIVQTELTQLFQNMNAVGFIL